MKKIALVLFVSMILTLVSCSSTKNDSWGWSKEEKAKDTGITLNVYNWGEYIAPDTNDAFEHLTGIHVNYKTFTDNESMYAILAAGTDYDVIIPSDYMIGKMIKEDRLEPLNFNNIPNFKYISKSLLNLEYDPENKYSVPYTWGTICIFYNDQFVDEEDIKAGWDLLWNPKYKGKIFMFDNPRDAFGITLSKLGLSMNSEKKEDWDAAYKALVEQKPLLQQYVMDQVFQKMINEEGWIAPYYSGDGAIMMDPDEGNEHIKSFIPDQPTNRFVDAMCIPKGAKHKKEAEMYINFMCRTEVAKANAEEICYSSPHDEALKLLDPEIANDPVFYPPQSVLDKAEVFLTLSDETTQYYTDLWEKLKKQ